MNNNIIAERLDFVLDMYARTQEGNKGARRQFVMFEGPHGVGKTALVHQWGKDRDVRVVERSLAQVDVTAFAMSVPVETGSDHWIVRTMLVEELKPRFPEEKVLLFFDEANRADKYLFSVVMEMWSEFTINGIEMPHLVGCAAAINSEGDDSMAGIGSFDLAQARRATMWVDIDDSKIPWEDFLLGLADPGNKEQKANITKFCDTIKSFPADVRRQIPPRVRHWMVLLAKEGLPLQWGTGAVGDTYIPIVDMQVKEDKSEGVRVDSTASYLSRLAQALKTPALASEVTDAYSRALDFCIKYNLNLRIIGGTGIAKTSRTKEELRKRGIDSVYLSLSTITPEALAYSVPVADRIETVVCERLLPETATQRKRVLLADEFSRASRRTAAAVMPITQGKRLRGQDLALDFTIALDNPPGHGKAAMDSGRIDVAQATRFPVTIFVDEFTMGCREYLVDLFGELAEVAWAWRAEAVAEDLKPFCPPSLIEAMLNLYKAGLPIEDAVYKIGGIRINLPIVMLQARLDGVLEGYSALAAKAKETVHKLYETGDELLMSKITETVQAADPDILLKDPQTVAWLMALCRPDMRKGTLLTLVNLNQSKSNSSATNALVSCFNILGASSILDMLTSFKIAAAKKDIDPYTFPEVKRAEDLWEQRRKAIGTASSPADAIAKCKPLTAALDDLKVVINDMCRTMA